MGNRAFIEFKGSECGIYLHWNGGRDSIEGFLTYCEMRGFGTDPVEHSLALMTQVIANFFGGSTSVCVGLRSEWGSAADWDNGTYVVDGWRIVGRKDAPLTEQRVHPLAEFVVAVDEAQPLKEQLGEAAIREKLATWTPSCKREVADE